VTSQEEPRQPEDDFESCLIEILLIIFTSELNKKRPQVELKHPEEDFV